MYILVLLLPLLFAHTLGGSCNIATRGAEGNGKTLNTKVIQGVLDDDACSEVIIPQGVFLTSALNLTRSNVVISLVGEIKATTSTQGWALMPPIPSYACERDICASARYQPVLLVYAARNVSILGGSSAATINGQGAHWWKLHEQRKLTYGRPRLLETMFATDVTLRNFLLLDSPFWTSHYFASKRIEIDHVNVYGHGPNTDGFDPDSSSDVWIHDCEVNNGDDCVAIKSGMNEAGIRFGMPSSNILIERLVCRHGDGISIGSEMSGGVSNVTVRHVRNILTNNGMYLKTSIQRGGYIRNVSFSNITFDGTQTMIKFRVNYEAAHGSSEHIPVIDGISYRDFRGAGLTAGTLDCSETIPCSNITMDSISLIAFKGFSCTGVSGSAHHVQPKICF